ncbi:MAG: Uma2 family endonuclease [Deltaproteobacteria bacterium]|nr:Uma2 family endonuclease [Deltaproteobacteria bacterium]
MDGPNRASTESPTAVQPEPFLTPAQYLNAERRTGHKSEYLNGEVFAMSGASARHVLIVTNVVREFGTQFKNRDCRIFSSDLRVKVSATGLYTYPDVVAICGPLSFGDSEGAQTHPAAGEEGAQALRPRVPSRPSREPATRHARVGACASARARRGTKNLGNRFPCRVPARIVHGVGVVGTRLYLPLGEGSVSERGRPAEEGAGDRDLSRGGGKAHVEDVLAGPVEEDHVESFHLRPVGFGGGVGPIQGQVAADPLGLQASARDDGERELTGIVDHTEEIRRVDVDQLEAVDAGVQVGVCRPETGLGQGTRLGAGVHAAVQRQVLT